MFSFRSLWASAGIAVLTLGALTTAQAQTNFSLFVPEYDSPTYTNTLGSGAFSVFGRNATIPLTPGVLTAVFLDQDEAASFNGPTTNSDPTITFSDTVLTPVTLDGLTQNVPFDVTFTPAGRLANSPSFLAGPPVDFTFASGVVTVTPIASISLREADFLFTPATSVPEPGAYVLLGSLGLTGAAFLRRRRAR